jgi:hypothetical protein
MEANALDRKFERPFLETFLPKACPKAGIGAIGLCQKFDRPAVFWIISIAHL